MMSTINAARINAFWGALIGDALSMPVHWFYIPQEIPRFLEEYVSKYHEAPFGHPTSILHVSSVDSSGRTRAKPDSDPIIDLAGRTRKSKNNPTVDPERKNRPKPKNDSIVGNIILHGKLEIWKNGKSGHYHQDMKAGDNTLNSLLATQVLDVLEKSDPDRTMDMRELQGKVLERYVTFMTTPGTHNDTYAESWHRAFFRDWVMEETRPTSGADLLAFAEERSKRLEQQRPDTQLLVVSGITSALPWIVHYAAESEDRVVEVALAFVRLSHPVKRISSYIELFARCLHRVFHGQPLKEAAREALNTPKILGVNDNQLMRMHQSVLNHERGSDGELKIFHEIANMLGCECYIRGALSLALVLVYIFHDDYRGGIMMNANVGGDNCHRASVVGSLLGACLPIPEDLKTGLHSVADKWNDVRSSM